MSFHPDPPLWAVAPTHHRRRWRIALLITLVAAVLLGVLGTSDAAGAHTQRGHRATPANASRHPWSTDGCSASPERGPGWDFHHACIHHDGCYRGHWASRGTCDEWFRLDMRASCTVTNRSAGLARDLCHWLAAIYHQAVRRFGGSAYARGSTYVPLR
jgi:hypothetical protein